MSFDLLTRDAEVRIYEVRDKLAAIRDALEPNTAVRLRGSDWFSWITAGASNVVLLTTHIGIAEVLVTPDQAWVLTDPIEAQRLIDEELPSLFSLQVDPWAHPAERENAVQKIAQGMSVVSDLPGPNENALPSNILPLKRVMSPAEVVRYRRVGRWASEAMREVLSAANSEWSEYQLAGAGAEALWARGLHPALTMAAGARRMAVYRHPTATTEKLGRRAMLVFCARGFGLYANLTRFVSFDTPSTEWRKLQQQVCEIEAETLDACRAKTRLSEIYQTLSTTYREHGHPLAINEHHQGGTTGYLAREIVATPHTHDLLTESTPMAWNPSLRGGGKIEDTFITTATGLENLTYDPVWPHVIVHGRQRPLVLEL